MASLSLFSDHPADVLQHHKGSPASTPFVSAPASPSHPYASTETAAIPFCWEDKPGTPKARGRIINRPAPLALISDDPNADEDDDDMNNHITNSEFEFASARFGDGFLDDPPLSPAPLSSCSSPFFAIQPPLRPPPRLDLPPGPRSSVRQLLLQHDGLHIPRAPRSPRSPSAFSCSSSLSGPPSPPSPRIGLGFRSLCCVVPDEQDAFDPFSAAMEKMAGDAPPLTPIDKRTDRPASPVMNHATIPKSSSSSSSSSASSSSSSSSTSSPSPSSKKWKFRNMLHRSPKNKDGQTAASPRNRTAIIDERETCQVQQTVHSNTLRSSFDGRESLINKTRSSSIDIDRDTLQLIKTRRSTDGRETPKLPTPPRTPRGPAESTQPPTPTKRSGTGPYAVHYATQRAQIEEMRRRTLLPYKPGLLGCLGFSPKSYVKAYMANPSPMA